MGLVNQSNNVIQKEFMSAFVILLIEISDFTAMKMLIVVCYE
jgi:hypothetical protein